MIILIAQQFSYHNGDNQSARLLGQWLASHLTSTLPFKQTPILTDTTTDLKSTTDDALSPYLTTLPTPYTFTQDHTLTNIRFLLGYTAVAIAGATFYADRYLGWEATTSPWVIAAVGAYFVLNGVFTYWVWFVEGGEVFRGRRGSGELVNCIPSLIYMQICL